jgi:hypothetical protein
MPADLTEVDFSVEDELEGKPLTPDNMNLPILRAFLEEVETFAKGDVPGITLNESRVKIEEGSLKVKMLLGAALAFSIQSDLEKLKETGDLDQIQPRRAQVIEKWQSRAEKASKRSYSVHGGDLKVKITSESHFEHGNEKSWVNVEKYFTGKVYNAGGKQEPNVHVELENGETLRIDATEQQLSGVKDNVLFKARTLRVQAQQHLRTKALRDLRLIEFIPYASEVDEEGLAALWKKGAEAWKHVESATEWVEKLRGNS